MLGLNNFANLTLIGDSKHHDTTDGSKLKWYRGQQKNKSSSSESANEAEAIKDEIRKAKLKKATNFEGLGANLQDGIHVKKNQTKRRRTLSSSMQNPDYVKRYTQLEDQIDAMLKNLPHNDVKDYKTLSLNSKVDKVSVAKPPPVSTAIHESSQGDDYRINQTNVE